MGWRDKVAERQVAERQRIVSKAHSPHHQATIGRRHPFIRK